MIALAGIGRHVHLPQKRVHVLGLEATPGPHRIVAGDGGEHMVEPVLKCQRGAPVFETVDEIADKTRYVALGDRGRNLGYRNGTGAEGLDDETEFGQRRCPFDKPICFCRVEIDDDGDQKCLPGDGAGRTLAL